MVMTKDCGELTDQKTITGICLNNKEIFQTAVDTGDYSEVEKLEGIRDVTEHDDYIEFYCGGTGMGSNTNYYGILYSELDVSLIAPTNGYTVTREGGVVRIEEDRGDNLFIYTSLGDGFWFYEEHY